MLADIFIIMHVICLKVQYMRVGYLLNPFSHQTEGSMLK